MVEILIIKEKQEFDNLKPEWDYLVENSINNSVFLRHDWFKSVIEAYNLQIVIIIAKENNRIKGILPLQRTKAGDLEFINCDTTTLNDVIYNGSYEILEDLLDKVFEIKKWNLLSLIKIPDNSKTIEHLKKYLAKKKIEFRLSDIECPQVNINTSWDEFKASKRERFRKMLRYVKNRIEKLGATIELHEENKEYIFKDFLEVSSHSWLAKEGHALVNEGSKIKLYKQLFEIASNNKWLFAWILRKGKEPIAIEFDLKYKNELYALMANYKEEYKDYSPGTYLHTQIVKNCFDNRIKIYNMGPGLNQYKIGWTNSVRNLLGFTIFKNKIKSKAIYNYINLKELLKKNL